MESVREISADFPFESRFADVYGSRIHYIDVGEGPVFLFMHGNPTWSYLWRNVIPPIAKHGRCIAFDLPGFGRSDRPDIGYTFLENYKYVDGFMHALNLKDVVLVTHDWGGALGFYYAMNDPENVKGIAFMETFAMTFTWDDFPADFKTGFKLFRTPLVGRFMIMVLNAFIEKLMPQTVHRGLAKEIHDNYRAPFPTVKSRYPVYRWPNEIPIDDRKNNTYRAIAELEGRFKDFRFPMLMFTSTPGAVMVERSLRFFRDNARDLSERELGPGIHYVQEDNPTGIAEGVIEWAREKGLIQEPEAPFPAAS